jgi:hypothetical protein
MKFYKGLSRCWPLFILSTWKKCLCISLALWFIYLFLKIIFSSPFFLIYFEILLIRYWISAWPYTSLALFLIYLFSFSVLFSLGDFLNIPTLLLNILVWKLDFNFLRMFLVSESPHFPEAYSYFMKVISPRPFLQIVFGMFLVAIVPSCISLLRFHNSK